MFRVAQAGDLWRVVDDTQRQWRALTDRADAHREAVDLYRTAVGPLGTHQWDDPARMLEPLRGRVLLCWCPPDLACHADLLLAWANPGGEERWGTGNL